MIFSGFVYLAAYLLQLVIFVLPVGTGFPPEVQSAFTSLGGYVGLLNTLLPISTLAAVLAILIATDIAIFGFKTFRWIIGYIPFVGGRG